MTLVLIVFAVLLVLGMPVAFAMAIAGFIFFLQQPMLPLTMPVQRILSETQSFSLLAIPMFVFAGNLMNGPDHQITVRQLVGHDGRCGG